MVLDVSREFMECSFPLPRHAGLATLSPDVSMPFISDGLPTVQNIQSARIIQPTHTSIPFQQHQPAAVGGGTVIIVGGNVQLAGEQHGLNFIQRERLLTPYEWAWAFAKQYYATLDGNPAGVADLYRDDSMLSFEGEKIQGARNIMAKLTSLPFQKCQHSIKTVDCQPSGVSGGMLVFVTGSLKLGGEQHALKFSQMFHLVPTPQGSYYVLNDIFRLNHA